ncbi:hypothetical protein THAOC_23652, partial [Thalassiosira oceanica]
MDIMCTESDHVTLPAMTPSDEVYGLCTSASASSSSGLDSTICVMTVDYRHYPDQEAIVASWRQSLEADGFTRLDIGDEEELTSLLCLWPNWEDQDYYCHYRLTMHCKDNAVSATLPPVPQGHDDPGHWAYDRTLSMGVCAYGSDVHTALATVGGNSFTPVSSSDIDGRPDGHRIFFSDNQYWDLVGFENTPCNNGGIFLQAPAILGIGGVASVTVSPVDAWPLAYTALSVAHLNEAQPIVWDDTRDGEIYQIGGFHGVCVFFAGHQRGQWGPDLESLGWIYEGNPTGFGYGNVLLDLYCHGNFDLVPTSSDSSLTYERVVISSINEPVQMWGDSVHYQVSGFESTPCQTFYRSSLTNAPHGAVTALNEPVFCVMYPDVDYLVSWQESLESEEYGFTRLDSQGLYMRLNGGDHVGTTANLTMHCKYNAVSATLPPLTITNRIIRGLCAFGYDNAAATISGNPFIAIHTSGLSEPWHVWNDNPSWDLHGFSGTPCRDGIYLQGPAITSAGQVVSATLNQLQDLGSPPAAELLPLSV